MNEIDSLKERLSAITYAINVTRNASSVDRRLSHSTHINTHFTKAIEELTTLHSGLSALLTRYECLNK